MKTSIGLTTLVLALAACGRTEETTVTGGATEGTTEATATGNNSFPTTSGTSEGSNSESVTNDTSVSGNSESLSGTTTDPTTGGPSSDPSSASETTTATDSAATATDSTTGDDTTGDDTTGSTSDGTTIGVDSDSTTGSTSTTLGDESSSGGTTMGDPGCDNVLDVMVRDFKLEHPDFEDYAGNAAFKGLVKPDLGADMKPVYAAAGPTPQTSGPDAFKQWYNDTPNVNQAIPIQLTLTEIMPGIFQYNNNAFFPIDNQGWGNQGQEHNFAFTTEIHTQFVYNGGEVFTFTGDDDLWMFINGKLALDIGGLHPPVSDSIMLDAEAVKLGISPGLVYTMDIFHAERHSTGSNFRIDTTIGCFLPQ